MINDWYCEWFKVGGINVVLLATLYVDHCKQYYSYHNMAVTLDIFPSTTLNRIIIEDAEGWRF